ncbi:MAG TPA: TetR family transcriptional regulator [Solirubrobacteraceae bacterium]
MSDTLATMSAAGQRLPYSVAAKELLRNTLLDAACHELESHRWADITMADIALAAGVSRQTLYKEFGSREEFTQVLALREAERFLDAVEQAVMSHVRDPARAVQAAFEVFLTAAAENPMVRAIVQEDGAEELLAMFTSHGEPLVTGAAARLRAVMAAGWPLIPPRDAELLADCLVRLAISYASLPRGSAASTSQAIARLLGPYVQSLVVEQTP